MSGYVVALIEIHDAEEYRIYLDGLAPILARHGGQMLAVDPRIETIDGEWDATRMVIMKFPSAEAARG